MRFKFIYQFLQLESASGLILLMTTLLAVLWVNSPLLFLYQYFQQTSLFWINDGLMTLFFLVIGLELRRELSHGQLTTEQLRLAIIAALGGMVVPALIYCAFNYHNPITIKAWATPVATDIAFAVGVLSLFGSRVPVSLKLFLLSLAIFDDVGAILIIAFFYSSGIVLIWLVFAAIMMMMLIVCKHFRWNSFLPYLLFGVGLWLGFLKAGIHPTIAGVLLAFTLPSVNQYGPSLALSVEERLHPWVAYVAMPLFALANAGLSLQGLSQTQWLNTTVLGIALGLFIGKQTGVFLFAFLFIKTKWAAMPKKASWLQLYGIALLCGIGFTMSLFLGTLSFQDQPLHHLTDVRLGVIMGSILSGLSGAIILWVGTIYLRRSFVD